MARIGVWEGPEHNNFKSVTSITINA
jgi:hypothetical protein